MNDYVIHELKNETDVAGVVYNHLTSDANNSDANITSTVRLTNHAILSDR